jgi:hypothetical protein
LEGKEIIRTCLAGFLKNDESLGRDDLAWDFF